MNGLSVLGFVLAVLVVAYLWHYKDQPKDSYEEWQRRQAALKRISGQEDNEDQRGA